MSKEIVRLYNYLERVDYLEDVLPNNPTTLELINSFFLNQQFITQGAVADHGSYNVTTYIRTKEKKRKEKKRRKRTEEKEKKRGKHTKLKAEQTTVILSWKEKAPRLYSRNTMK